MRFLLPLLLIGCGAAVWFLVLDDDGVDPASLPYPEDPRVPFPQVPVPFEVQANTIVVEEEPSDLWGYEPDADDSIIDDRRTNETLLRFPRNEKMLTGEMMLKALSTVYGPDRPFRFVGKESLEKFSKWAEPMTGRNQELVQEVIGRIYAAGWRLIERDGGIWVITVEGRD